MLWPLHVLAGLTALYGLHRLALHLEDRGYLYYKHKKPTAGGGSSFLPLQEFIQPQIHHVIEAEENRSAKRGDERTGSDRPDFPVWQAEAPAEGEGTKPPPDHA